MATALPLPEKIMRGSNPEVSHRSLSAQFGDGYEQVAPDGLNTRQELWDVTWGNLSQLQVLQVTQFLNSVGAWGTIEWTPCYEATSRKFRVVNGKYKRKTISNSDFQISCQLKRVYDV